MKNTKPKLAVIGTGIAGLSSAWLLNKKFDVTVYESAPRAGMGAHTIDYSSRGIDTRIDVPLRIFCKGYYDNLMALYDHIGVEMKVSDHSGAFADGRGRMLFHYGNFKLGDSSVAFPKGRSLVHPRTWLLALQSEHFFKRARKDIANRDWLANMTFGEYLRRRRIGKQFVETLLLPVLSVTCTCDYQSLREYPADIMLGYLTCGVREFGIMSAAKGVDDIVPRLLQGIELKTSCAVREVVQEGEQLRVTTALGDSALFDHVVVASQAQQAAEMLNGFDQQRVLLQRVPFETSYMSVHTDRAMLPKSQVPVSPVSYILPKGAKRSQVTVDLTKAFDRFRKQESVFQTWNPIREPRAGKELARIKFTRPVVNHRSRAAMKNLRELQLREGNRLWFCGSYITADKIPLLDAAVDASVTIAESLGVAIPWKSETERDVA